MKITISAPGKVILSGEHSVVYGHPALLAATDNRLTVSLKGKRNKKILTKSALNKLSNFELPSLKKFLSQYFRKENFNLKLESDIPIGCGLGSSAAYSVVFSALLNKIMGFQKSLKRINTLAYEIEKQFHKNPSGGDNTTSTYGGYLWYRKEAEGLKTFSKIEVKKKLDNLVLVNSGRANESTKDMVEIVRSKREANAKKIYGIFNSIEDVTKGFLKYLLQEQDLSLKYLLKQNQKLLEKLGVVSSSTKILVKRLEKKGAALKVAGAGGLETGSGILISFHDNTEVYKRYLKKQKLDFFVAKLGGKGVILHEES
ncbi:MAG: mevalonate kinase [Candidatus Woesebacteria bacterium]|jgi:mevalonate kinase